MFVTILRTVILYILVIFAIRIMGKRQIGDMQPGELVITILISEIAAIPIQDLSQPVMTGVVAVFTLVFLEIAVSVITMKILPLRKLFYGDSAIIIKDGKLDQKKLKSLRVTGPDLLEVLRNQGVFDISEVSFAILETNGQLSVMLKPDRRPATVGDIRGECQEKSMPCLVISDGRLIEDSTLINHVSKTKIIKKLNDEKVNIKDIFIMTCDREMNCTIIRKDKK
jgi:uncharacterized membrane protein YcaP (DUF421 family)